MTEVEVWHSGGIFFGPRRAGSTITWRLVFEGGSMYNDRDEQVPETNRHHVRLTQQLIGVVGEEEYFARQEAERKRKLAEARQAKLLAEEREKARALHSMKCPKCGMQLEEVAFGDVRIDKCFACEGLWLDKGELKVIQQKQGGFMMRMLGIFR
jgi:uncharacterized protein